MPENYIFSAANFFKAILLNLALRKIIAFQYSFYKKITPR